MLPPSGGSPTLTPRSIGGSSATRSSSLHSQPASTSSGEGGGSTGKGGGACALRTFRKHSTADHSGAANRKLMSVHIKSKLGAEFRRFSITLPANARPSFRDFADQVFFIHGMDETLREGFSLEYLDPSDGTHLPISNDETLRVAVDGRSPTLRLFLQQRGETIESQHGYGVSKEMLRSAKKRPIISAPQDFRRVSAIVDVDVLPCTLRRVQLCKHKTNLPLGFFIRDGISFRAGYPQEGIFISRLVENGIAASTNLLHPNDEILEVNGIDVTNKTLDQVTDVMIANSFNLILTVRPAFDSPIGMFGGADPMIFPPGYSSLRGKTFQHGIKSYYDIPLNNGTISSRGSSGENNSPPMPHQYFGSPKMINPYYQPNPYTSGYHFAPSLPPHLMPPYSFGAPPSFSRKTTLRQSDKDKKEKLIPSPGEMRQLRRPFSLYAPNLHG